MENHVGIAGFGIYLPEKTMSAKEISEATKGVWSPEAVYEKLGVKEKRIAAAHEGAQAMGAWAASDALRDAGIPASEIDCVLCITEEWKEYPLTTSANYIIKEIAAVNAWGIDVQNRCCTTVTAVKMAKDMLMSDEDMNCILIAGGYRNCDLVNYEDNELSMMFDLGAGGGAMILKKNLGRNIVLGSHIISDGSLARSAGALVGGTALPTTSVNWHDHFILAVMEPSVMKNRLKEVSAENWSKCITKAFEKSGLPEKIDYLAMLHFKRSAFEGFLKANGLTAEQSIYLEDYGHIGQIDQILSLKLARDEVRLKNGDAVVLLAAGIGYTWAASVVKWGSIS